MATVQRLKSVKEGWFQVLKMIYLIIGLPFLLIVGTLSLAVLPATSPGAATRDLLTLIVFFWIPIVIPMCLFYLGFRVRRKLLKSILSTLKSEAMFWPVEGDEFFLPHSGKYFGIDTKNGTLLFIHRIRKGQVDVVGLTMGDWTNRELEGNTLRLYTKYLDLPCIEIKTPWARRWYDTLGAMEYKRYSTPVPFSQYVSQHVEALERDNKIHIPKLA